MVKSMIDVHVHLLAGLDDGPGSVEESVALASLLVKQGVTTAVATVHNYEGAYEASADAIRRAATDLQAVLDEMQVPLEIVPAMEIQLREGVADKLRQGELMTIGDRGAFVLVELPFHDISMNVAEVLFRIQVTGLRCILAHPERNARILEDIGIVEDLVERGCRMQINAGSLVRRGDRRTFKFVRTMLRRGLVTYIASDAHSPLDRSPMLSEALAVARKIVGAEAAEVLVERNPARMLQARPF